LKNKILVIIGWYLLITNANAQLVNPQFTNGKYKLEVANVSFEITPDIGARFSSLKVDGTEILYIEEGSGNWGSSFWPSPQSVWGWPPSNELDTDPYSGGIIDNKIWLTSETDEKTNLSFSKSAYADMSDNSITFDYVMINHKNVAQTYAPWEVTRVTTDGIAYFPVGDNDVTGDMAGSTQIIDNYVWYDNANSTGSKIFSDSKGWIAYVDENRNLLLKIFEDISVENTAPGEGEVEVYAGAGYVEVENQGTYASIAPNDSVNWTVKWYSCKLPENIDISIGSQSLIDYTNNIIINGNSSTNSVDELEQSLYPNPAINFVYLNNSIYNGQSFFIYNLNGQTILKGVIENQTINISSINKGYYIIKIDVDGKLQIGSILK
jgi:hypothetical protein